MTLDLDQPLLNALLAGEPVLWINPGRGTPAHHQELDCADMRDAEERLRRFAPTLERLFPELVASQGIIESDLVPIPQFAGAVGASVHDRWFVKADHALPIVGSIKARGGIYEVLVHAEALARDAGLLGTDEDDHRLDTPELRALFEQHSVLVGSTGNLGLSIGTIAAALGFKAIVHMSSDAKEWKKIRLRTLGVEVVEHSGDYETAVAAGRESAEKDTRSYFVDDENSRHLFLGYSVAALRLRDQLTAQGISVDAEHPLFVYIPCGVGGAPGGIAYGLSCIFGPFVHCFFAEPTASPAMLVALASKALRSPSVRDVGLDNRTEADGLAVARASELARDMIRPLISGVFTAEDRQLLQDLYLLNTTQNMKIEPSAAAALRGPRWLGTEEGNKYLLANDLTARLDQLTHVIWTTGGALAPDADYFGWWQAGAVQAQARQ